MRSGGEPLRLTTSHAFLVSLRGLSPDSHSLLSRVIPSGMRTCWDFSPPSKKFSRSRVLLLAPLHSEAPPKHRLHSLFPTPLPTPSGLPRRGLPAARPLSQLSSSKDHSLVFNPKFSLQSSSYSLNKYLLTSCCARHDTRCRRQSTEQNKPLTTPPKKKLPTLMELIFWCGVERQTI